MTNGRNIAKNNTKELNDLSQQNPATSLTAASLHRLIGKALRVKGVVRKPRKLLLLHLPAPPAQNPPDIHLRIYPHVPAGKVPNPPYLLAVEAPVRPSTTSTYRFFWLRSSRITLALGSPNIPLIVAFGRNPGKLYASSNLLFFGIRLS